MNDRIRSALALCLISVLMLSVISCGNKTDVLALPSKEVDYLNKTGNVLNGKELDLEIIGAVDLVVCDSLLVVTTNNPNGLIQVLRLSDLQPLASFGTKGRTRNEFNWEPCNYTRQYYYRNGDIIMPFYDNASDVLKEVNISESIRQGRTVTEGIMDCQSMLGLGMDNVALDNDFGHRFMVNAVWSDEQNNIAVRFCSSNRNDTTEIPVFNEKLESPVDNLSSIAVVIGILHKNPERNRIVYPLQYLDYIFVFDADTGEHFAIHQKESSNIATALKNSDLELNTLTFYGSAAVTPDFFLILYQGGDYSKTGGKTEEQKQELLAFDWDGNYLGGVKLGSDVRSIAYDQSHNMLYGLNTVYETFYSFDLTEFTKSFAKASLLTE